MAALRADAADMVRRQWEKLLAEGVPLEHSECYSTAVLRKIPTQVEEELRRQILRPQLARRQLRNREAGVRIPDAWKPCELAPGTEKVAFIREKIHRLLVAVAKWDPEASRNRDLFELQVALVAACRVERLSFCLLARLYSYFRVPDCAKEFDREPASDMRQPPEILLPDMIELLRATNLTTTSQSTATPSTDRSSRESSEILLEAPASAMIRPASLSEELAPDCARGRASEAGEKLLLEEVVEIWHGIQQQYPLVARAIKQDRRTLRSFAACVRRWLQTLFSAGCSTNDKQLHEYVQLLTFMLDLACHRRAQKEPRRILAHIAICIFGGCRTEIEDPSMDVEGIDALLQRFAERPPIDSHVIAAVAKPGAASRPMLSEFMAPRRGVRSAGQQSWPRLCACPLESVGDRIALFVSTSLWETDPAASQVDAGFGPSFRAALALLGV